MSARVPLQKVGPNVWVIPKSYRQDMRVPVYVFASEKLLEKMTTDRTLIQGVNVATLPGVQKHVAVLPDAHEGYGFPIGGVAAMDATEGVISPGGVGYDINCLPAGTMVLTSLGYRIPIERFTGDEEVVCVNQKRSVPAGIVFVIKKGRDRLLRIRTKSRFVLTATPDHPVLTPDGMKPLEEIRPGERIALFPFEGVEYEDPGDRVILDETDLPENVRSELKKRGLLPLRLDNPKLPYLARLLGYFTGDGTFDGKATVFYGSAEGLEEIRRDIELLGYRPSRVLTRRRQSVINGRKFIGVEGSVRVSSRSFTELLKRLGAPDGKKTDVEFLVPRWILAAPRWIKRLYLAGLFGAELNKPQTVNGYNFEVPQLTLSKRPDLELNGRLFLEQIAELLRELGVETTSIVAAQEGRCVRLRLLISERPENLIRLWSRVGYEYNPQRRRLALAAVVWLRLKQSVIDLRMRAQEVAIAMAADGATISEIREALTSEFVNERYLERSVYEGREDAPRVPRGFPRFEDWAELHLDGDIVWDEVDSVEEAGEVDEVYDLTVANPGHSFIADGFVVSNCGVRLMVTNLTEKEVRPKIVELINVIFRNVPAGLGSRRKDFVFSMSDLDRVALEGARYIIERYGLGWPEDYKHIEEEGRYPRYKTGDIPDPDPSVVSREAKSRGLDQIGTLGSGNHFLEVQKVDRIFDREAARRMGIYEEGQITILIHCGSRGYGHQICSDYLRVMERAVHKYNLRLPDRELACTPASSPEATMYLKAFGCAVNFAFANRQAISHWVRQSFEQVFKRPAEEMEMKIVYDVCHNIVKLERHKIDGETRDVFVHRKGATRSFPGNTPYYSDMIPADYRDLGQPVFVPGSMGTASWVLLGQPGSLELTFGSSVHGAGRQMSRAGAKRQYRGDMVVKALESKGIYVKGDTMDTIVEEVPEAYKNPDDVVEVAHSVGISTKVARLVPIGVVKG